MFFSLLYNYSLVTEQCSKTSTRLVSIRITYITSLCWLDSPLSLSFLLLFFCLCEILTCFMIITRHQIHFNCTHLNIVDKALIDASFFFSHAERDLFTILTIPVLGISCNVNLTLTLFYILHRQNIFLKLNLHLLPKCFNLKFASIL